MSINKEKEMKKLNLLIKQVKETAEDLELSTMEVSLIIYYTINKGV